MLNPLKGMDSRCVLSDKTIQEYMKKGQLIATSIKPEQVQPNSIDITLGNTWKKLKPNKVLDIRDSLVLYPETDSMSTIENIIDIKLPIKYDEGLFSLDDNGNEYYKIMPGEFVLMASNEYMNIPNGILSFVQGRSSIARLGIQTEQAGLIDAGFCGTITLECYNQTNYPIILYAGMRIAQVYFFKAQYASKVYGSEKGSKYNTQVAATGSMIHKDFHK